jgi:WD40 repeat protein
MKKQLHTFPVLLMFLTLFCFCSRDGNSQKAVWEGKIALGNIHGRIDHMAADLVHDRLFICALGNNTVEIADIKSNKHLFTIRDIKEPQGVVYIPYTNRIIVSGGEDGIVNLYDGTTYKLLNTIKGLPDADNMRYDSVIKKIYVGYGEGGIAVIDAINFTKIGNIELPAHPESFQLSGNLVYINIPGKDLIAVADLEKLKILSQWSIKDAMSNYPMALYTADKLLITGCREPAKILVYNYMKGEYISSVKCDGDIDDLFFDPVSSRLYATCGEGYLDIMQYSRTGGLKMIKKLATGSRARTSIYVPELNKIFIAIPKSGISEAFIGILATDKL